MHVQFNLLVGIKGLISSLGIAEDRFKDECFFGVISALVISSSISASGVVSLLSVNSVALLSSQSSLFNFDR